MRTPDVPVVVQLAEQLGGKWKAIRDGFGWYWVGPNGRTIRPYSELIMGYDGYLDDKFNIAYIDDKGVKVGINGLIYAKEDFLP
jgi:hypothetical protein